MFTRKQELIDEYQRLQRSIANMKRQAYKLSKLLPEYDQALIRKRFVTLDRGLYVSDKDTIPKLIQKLADIRERWFKAMQSYDAVVHRVTEQMERKQAAGL